MPDIGGLGGASATRWRGRNGGGGGVRLARRGRVEVPAGEVVAGADAREKVRAGGLPQGGPEAADGGVQPAGGGVRARAGPQGGDELVAGRTGPVHRQE